MYKDSLDRLSLYKEDRKESIQKSCRGLVESELTTELQGCGFFKMEKQRLVKMMLVIWANQKRIKPMSHGLSNLCWSKSRLNEDLNDRLLNHCRSILSNLLRHLVK